MLLQTIRDGVGLLTWQSETFAYADGYDEAASRYRGLRGGDVVTLSVDSGGLVVKGDVARRQLDLDAETARKGSGATDGATTYGGAGASSASEVREGAAEPSPPPARPRRFHGTVALDPTRAGRDASRIADEVIAHLVAQLGAEVTVTLEIDVTLPDGANDQLVRTVTENSRTLRFETYEFEKE